MTFGDKFKLILIALGLLVSGCISIPKLTGQTSPWTPPKDIQKKDNVWSEVRELRYDFSKPLTLAQITDIAISNNPVCTKAWSEAKASVAAVEKARGYFMPAITAVASENSQQVTANPEKYDSDYTKSVYGLQLNYLVLSFGGGRGAAVEQALQTVYAANFSFNKSLQDVLLASEIAYHVVISAQAGVKAAESSVIDFKKTLDAANERLNQHVGTALDVLQAQAGYDNALYNLANAQGQVKIAMGNLAFTMGVPSDTEILLTQPLSDIPESLALNNLKPIIDDSLARRPDISALRANLAAKEAAVKVAGSSMWPLLYLNGSYLKNTFDGETANPMQEDDITYLTGISLQWTLFDGFQNESTKRAAQAQADSARAQLKQAELAAAAEVWSRYQNYETALKKYKFSEAFLKSATASYEMALETYNSGIKSMLDLLDAEVKLAQARTQNVAAKQEVFTALANLAYATGCLENEGSAKAHNFILKSAEKDTIK